MRKIHDREITRALIVDDDQEARDAYEYVIEDLDIEPLQVSGGRLNDSATFIASVRATDVILCDFRLRTQSLCAV